jgi:DNA-binding Lrp family transcriptional regulator
MPYKIGGIMREEILRIIERNSRIDTGELAVRLGRDESDVVNEMMKMEEEGIICGYHTMINWEKTTQETVTALIEVRVTPQRGEGFDKIAERVYKYPEVKSVYLISGGFDLLVTLEGKTLKEVSMFISDKLSTLDTVISTSTHFILKKYKDHGTIMTKKKQDERQMITP